NGQSEPLSNVHSKPELFKYLNDNIAIELASSNLPGLERAKSIITRLQNKDLYIEIQRYTVNMAEEVKKYNDLQGKTVVAQATRRIQSTEQWFCSFNITFYKPLAGCEGVEIVSLEEARNLNDRSLTGEPSEAIEEYIVYCTVADPAVQSSAKHYFSQQLNWIG
uniref:Uncharacterized protein n=1 Tax=Anopheles epiroticus TaxID=199890 RepID=A0A182PJS6_9DIPT